MKESIESASAKEQYSHHAINLYAIEYKNISDATCFFSVSKLDANRPRNLHFTCKKHFYAK
jgi:hypothetical protein